MYRGRCMRTLVVVNTKTHCIVATRDEDMNSGSAAKITKPLYKLLTDGNHICYFAHRPDDIRVPAEINGRFFVKPMGWVPKVKVASTVPKVRKFYNPTGYADGTHYVEWDGQKMTCVTKAGTRHPAFNWNLAFAESQVKKGYLTEG